MPDVLPGPGEDPLALARRQSRIHIGRPRERLSHGDSLEPVCNPALCHPFYVSKVE